MSNDSLLLLGAPSEYQHTTRMAGASVGRQALKDCVATAVFMVGAACCNYVRTQGGGDGQMKRNMAARGRLAAPPPPPPPVLRGGLLGLQPFVPTLLQLAVPAAPLFNLSPSAAGLALMIALLIVLGGACEAAGGASFNPANNLMLFAVGKGGLGEHILRSVSVPVLKAIKGLLRLLGSGQLGANVFGCLQAGDRMCVCISSPPPLQVAQMVGGWGGAVLSHTVLPPEWTRWAVGAVQQHGKQQHCGTSVKLAPADAHRFHPRAAGSIAAPCLRCTHPADAPVCPCVLLSNLSLMGIGLRPGMGLLDGAACEFALGAVLAWVVLWSGTLCSG